MKVKVTFTIEFSRRRRTEPEEQFEHRDVDALVESADPDAPSVRRIGFTPERDQD